MSLPYRPGVGVMLLNSEGKVFVAKRLDQTAEAWQMPQGGIDKGEEPKVAVMRELKEEIGTNNVTLIAESKGWYTYDLPDELVPIIWGGKYRGQQQKWYLMRLNGDDSEIDINTHEPEFSTWQWIEAKRLPDMIVPFKKTLYQALLNEFSEYLP